LLLSILRKIEGRGAIEIARRIEQRVAAIYRYANAEGARLENPAVDINDALWNVPADKIKQERHLRSDEAFQHPIPLSSQSVVSLRAVRWLTGRWPIVFPSARSGLKPISESTIGYLYNRKGYKGRHVPHGWRSSFLTITNEQAERELGTDVRLLADRIIIDLMLAHPQRE